MKKILVIGLLLVSSFILFGCSDPRLKAKDHQKCKTLVISTEYDAAWLPVTCSPPVSLMDIYGSSRNELESLLGSPRLDLPIVGEREELPTDKSFSLTKSTAIRSGQIFVPIPDEVQQSSGQSIALIPSVMRSGASLTDIFYSAGNVVYYKDGGIQVLYHNEAANYVRLLPENLPMNPEAIVEFLGLTGQLGGPRPRPGWENRNDPITRMSWDGNSKYPGISVHSDEKTPLIVKSIHVGG